MKITLMYISKVKGEVTRDVDIDMDGLLTVRFLLDDDQHIDVSGRPDVETGGLHVMGKSVLSLHPGSGNSVAITSKYIR